MQPDPKPLYGQDPEADTEMTEDQALFTRQFLQPDEENETEMIEKVFWGAARALRLPGREEADNHGISRHLMLPSVSPMLPASFSKYLNWLISRREQLGVLQSPLWW